MFSFLDRAQPFGALVMRVALGVIMTAEGFSKIFPRGSLYEFTHWVASMGLPPWMGYLAAFTEFFGGILLVIGLLTRIAALATAGNMAVAIWKVNHSGIKGPHGMELPLACFALALMLVFTGCGYLGADDVVRR